MEQSKAVVHVIGAALTLCMVLSAGSATRADEKRKEQRKPLILVMNYPYQITGSASTKIHVVLFKPDFAPASGAKVTVNDKEVCVADANGTCVFDYVPGSNKSHLMVAKLTEGGTRYKAVKSFASNARTASFRSDQLFVYTDRGVYNPGDNILVRVMAWELLGDYKSLDKAKVKLLLQSQGGTKVLAGEELETNEFGIAATKLPVSENLAEGDYELVVLYNKARETARLRVERFKPPVMRINHDLKRFLTPAQNELPVKVDVAYFAGGMPKSATVTLKVQTSSGKEVVDKAFKELGDGRFEITLDKGALDAIRKNTAAEQPFKMIIAATDNFERTSKVTRDVVYTERPYRAVLEFDKDDYPPGELVKLQAKVVDLDGKPARGIKLVCGVAEFKVKEEAVTDDSGVAEFSFKMGKTAATAVVTSPVMKVPLGQKAVRLNSRKPMTSKVAEPPQKQGVQTRITVTFDKQYKPVEKVVHVDFTDLSGGLVVATTIPVSGEDGDWRAEGTVSAPAWGTMLANLYVCAVKQDELKKGRKLSIKNVGFITEGQHVTLYPDATAEIRFEGLKPEVKPGEKLTVTVDVKNPKGGDSAVGVMMVDNAVVSLLDPLEVTPNDHFYNPQRKVISTGGAGVLTWPVVDRNWGNPWRDIAYSNWGWKAPGPMVDGGRNGQGGDGIAMEGAAKGMGVGGGGSGGGFATGSAVGGLGAKKADKAKKASKMGLLKAMAAPAPEAEPAMAEEEASADEDDATVSRGRNGGDHGRERPKPQQITIRTRFPETALWEPLLKTRDGKTTFKVHFPDAITIQRLTVVSSGKLGGLGLEHQNIAVRQDLFVQADVPAALTAGDEVAIATVVRNNSDKEVDVALTPSASGLTLIDMADATVLRIPAGESAAATFSVKADFVGKVEFSVTAQGGNYTDTERRTFQVRPAGEPVTTEVRGEVSAAQAFEKSFELQPGAAHNSAIVSVAFPNVVPAIQAWQAMSEWPMAYVGVTGVASRALLDAALLEHARTVGLPEDQRKSLEGSLQRAAAELIAAQNADGSWGWFYLADASSDGGYVVSVYLSAYALKALVAVAEADVVVDPSALKKGVQFLLDSRNKDGLWSPTAWFWEVNAPETDWGLSGDLFETIVKAGRLAGGKPDSALGRIEDKFAGYLDKRPDEPGAVAHVLGGLAALDKWQKSSGRGRRIAAGLEYLITLKRKGYWEPHWYHAYGGMVELNARILELLNEVDPEGHQALRYEIVTWLLSTREAWGAWHNEIGTANAVRALLAAGAVGPQEKASTVTVKVNGTTVKSVAIRPDDVFLSAASLRFIDISNYVQEGDNRIEVAYDGNLTAPVAVAINQWPVRRKVSESKRPLRLERSAPARAALGEPVEVSLELHARSATPFVEIVDSVPATLSVDKASLDALVKAGAIQGYTLGDGDVALFVAKAEGDLKLTYRLLAVRQGTGTHAGARATARFHPQFGRALASGNKFIVE